MRLGVGSLGPAADSTSAALEHNPIRLVEFTRAFFLGGTEGQLVELLRALPAHYRVQVGALAARGPLLERVQRLGYLPTTFPLASSLARPQTALQVARLARWLMRERTELVHVHDFYSTLVVVPAARLARCKVVVGRLDLAHYHSPAQRAALVAFTHLADHVVANAEIIRNMLVAEEHLPAARVSVVRNGLDLAAFDRQYQQGLLAPVPELSGEPVVVHVANMNHPVKRQEDLLAALAMVQRQGLRLHAFLVGDGPRREELQKLARALGVGSVAHFLGHRADVPALYARATLGVLCSSAEGLSNALIEAMAAGLPLVVTRAGGNPELVAHGERGLVVPPCAPACLAEALRTLLLNPQAAQRMGQAARAFVARELSLERMVAAHDALYRRLARGSAPAV